MGRSGEGMTSFDCCAGILGEGGLGEGVVDGRMKGSSV
jgi:hypothetical protein